MGKREIFFAYYLHNSNLVCIFVTQCLTKIYFIMKDNGITYCFTKKNASKNKTPDGNRAHGVYGEIRKNNNVPYGYFSKYGNDKAIYGIKCRDTNMIYIGSTNHIQRRLMKHFSELFLNRHRNKRLQIDFNKYGFYNFDIIIFCDDNFIKNNNINILNKETEIQKSIGLEFIYNEKVTGFYITDELKKARANASKETHRSIKYREKMHNLKSNKIAQYDYYGNLIKIWDSSRTICDTTNYTKSVILSCCNGNKKTAYGYIWRYVDDNGDILTSGYIKARQRK